MRFRKTKTDGRRDGPMIRRAFTVAAVCAMAVGCAYVEPFVQQENPWQSPQSHWVFHKEGLRIDFALKPTVPDETQAAELEISIIDLSGPPPPRPVAGAGVKGTALMPRKPGHIHVLELRDLHKETSLGTYGMHLTFGMGGEWEARFSIVLPSGETLQASFPFIVSGSGAPPWERDK